MVEIAPRSLPVRLALGDAELQSGNPEEALSVAADLKVEFPSQSGGYLLEGRSLIALRRYAAAGNSLAEAFKRQPAWPILALRIQALRLADLSAEAMEANEAWAADNPGHVPSALMRAVLLQAAGRAEEAFAGYKSVVQSEPGNLAALNNAAWLAHELGEPEALLFAKRAYEHGPENAAVLDTYGWILLAEGQHEEAIEMLSRAVELAPQAPEIRYHLSEALVAGGESARARELLTALLTDGRDFNKRSDAERLLESVKTEAVSQP
jgi:tetratricopeptide (TPR) repeat protein